MKLIEWRCTKIYITFIKQVQTIYKTSKTSKITSQNKIEDVLYS